MTKMRLILILVMFSMLPGLAYASTVDFDANVTSGSIPLSVAFTDDTYYSTNTMTNYNFETGMPAVVGSSNLDYTRVNGVYSKSGTWSLSARATSTGSSFVAFSVGSIPQSTLTLGSAYVYCPTDTYVQYPYIKENGGSYRVVSGMNQGLKFIEGGHWTLVSTTGTTQSDWYTGVSYMTIRGAYLSDGTPDTTKTVYWDMTQCVSPYSIQWDFGDGNTSTTENPIHTYVTDGVYDVGLHDISGSTWGNKSNYIWTAGAPPIMTTPANGSTVNFDYPPMYSDITFEWDKIPGTSKIQVAEDSAFSNVIYEHETVGDSVSVSLRAGTYYWRVCSYDSVAGSYGDWPDEFYVMVVAESGGISGTGVQGTVYYSAALGDYQYIPGAVVTIYNDSYTIQRTTGSVGYYQVLGLANGTYYVLVEADGYDNSNIAAVNVTVGTVSIQDIAMQQEQSYFAPHYVKFIVKDKSLFGLVKTPVSNATVSVYENSNTNFLFSQKTGTDGACGFELSENIRYKLTIQSGNVTQTEYVTPASSVYEIILDGDGESLLPESQFYDVVNITVGKTIVNDSFATIDVTYTDSELQTNSVNLSLYEVVDNNGSLLLIDNDSCSGNCEKSFNLTSYAGKEYLVRLDVDHAMFSPITKRYTVDFPENKLPFTGKSMAVLAIVVLFYIGSMFGGADAGKAGILIVGMASVFWYMDIFSCFGDALNSKIGVGIIFAAVLAILNIFNEKRNEAGI